MVTTNDKYGPNTKQVEAFIALIPTLTVEQWVTVRNTCTATRAARSAAWGAARSAAWGAARYAAYDAAWKAVHNAAEAVAPSAFDAALALVVRDLISREHFDVLTVPFRAAGVDFDKLGVES